MLVQQYLPILVLVAIASVIALALVFASRILGPYRPNPKKLTPYESGMTPIGPAVRRLPVKFYLIAVLFILFDVEIIFLLPYAVIVRRLGLYGLIATGVVLLTYALGGLDWLELKTFDLRYLYANSIP